MGRGIGTIDDPATAPPSAAHASFPGTVGNDVGGKASGESGAEVESDFGQRQGSRSVVARNWMGAETM